MRWAALLSLGLFITPSFASASGEVEDLELELEERPTDVALRLEYADYLLALGRFDEALVSCDVAESLAKKDPAVSLTRGRIYYAMGELGLAEHYLSLHLKSKHPSAEAYLLRAKIREKTGRFKEAVEDYEAARLLGALALK